MLRVGLNWNPLCWMVGFNISLCQDTGRFESVILWFFPLQVVILYGDD